MEKPDQFAYHEVMDRISVIQDTFESAIVDHPVVTMNPEFRKKCLEVQDLLSELYSTVPTHE